MARKNSEILIREHQEAKKILAELDALIGFSAAETPVAAVAAAAPQNGNKENEMTISATKTVRDLAVELPGATRVFEKLGIDYCCGGGKSLADACASAKQPLESVMDSLQKAIAESQRASTMTDWAQARLAALITHIIEKHHAYTREELQRLEPLLAKVCKVHGQNHPELLQIQRLFGGLEQELTMHMMKEEQILFPYIVQMEEAVERGRPAPVSPFGTVQNPIRMMMMEHDSAGDALKQMRDLSGGFTAPADGCISYQTLYRALLDLEADLHQHIHLENNILFPRAERME